MSWTPRDHTLLTRLAKEARGGRPLGPSRTAMFYENLAAFPASSPSEDDLHACLDALSVAGAPPLDFPEHAEPTLLPMLQSDHPEAVRHAAAAALVAFWTHHPPSLASDLRHVLRHHTFDPRRRLRVLLASGEDQDLDGVVSLYDQAELSIDDVVFAQERILARDAPPQPTIDLLARLYEDASWLGRRILLQAPSAGHTFLIPTLARVATGADPTTRRAVVAALGRIGHVSAEPVLVSLLPDAAPNTTLDIAAILSAHGTRACLPHLYAARDRHPDLAPQLETAIELLDARLPIQANPGALSLVENDSAGALSLAGASPGDVSLYHSAEDALAQAALAPMHDSELTSHEHWYRLVTAPRHVPPGHLIASVGFNRGINLGVWVLAAAYLHLFPPAYAYEDVTVFLLVLMLSFGFLIALGFTVTRTRQERRMLRNGIPTFAELLDYQIISTGEGSAARLYTFRYMDEQARVHTTTMNFTRDVPEVTDDPLEPFLYTSTGETMPFDAISHVTIAASGQLTTPASTILLGALGPLAFLGSLLYLLL